MGLFRRYGLGRRLRAGRFRELNGIRPEMLKRFLRTLGRTDNTSQENFRQKVLKKFSPSPRFFFWLRKKKRKDLDYDLDPD